MLIEEVQEIVAIACNECGLPDLASRIHIRWNRRFIARMGDARWLPQLQHGLIRLSLPLWFRATRDEQIETVIHETCHIVADARFGPRQGHGPGWRHMMALCGYPAPRRCHTVDQAIIVERRRQKRARTARQDKRVRASCRCLDGVLVGPLQAMRIRNGRVYLCRICTSPVVIHGERSAQQGGTSHSLI